MSSPAIECKNHVSMFLGKKKPVVRTQQWWAEFAQTSEVVRQLDNSCKVSLKHRVTAKQAEDYRLAHQPDDSSDEDDEICGTCGEHYDECETCDCCPDDAKCLMLCKQMKAEQKQKKQKK